MSCPQPTPDQLPIHDQLNWVTRGIELLCIIVAATLAVWHLVRFVDWGSFWVWWSPIPLIAGILAADFASGIVHWTADTWGSETMPILGRRFVRPFRVHHVNPDDFLRRDVIDTNGDVAMIVIGFLAAASWLPLDQIWGQAASLFLFAFSVGGLPTNQVHQWAHMPSPPRLVRWFQQRGILLSHAAHARHHRSPYVVNYCIATGWCNPMLTAIRFFPRLESLVSRVTGLQPRCDDQSFSQNAMKALSHVGVIAPRDEARSDFNLGVGVDIHAPNLFRYVSLVTRSDDGHDMTATRVDGKQSEQDQEGEPDERSPGRMGSCDE